MKYVNVADRNQIEMMSLDMMVAPESVARLIDRFVSEYIENAVTFKNSNKRDFGRPSFNPYAMIKLYIYGYLNGIRSSRRLARECTINVEVMWLVEGITPDFRTIADFRKDNIDTFKQCFVRFIDFCKTDLRKVSGRNVFGGYKSIDGTKIRAVQAKDGCYTASKIDDRIINDKNRIAEYERYIEELDAQDVNDEKEQSTPSTISREKAEKALSDYRERLRKHEQIKDSIEVTGGQYSENDPESRLMKNHYGGFNPSFNIQTAVDSESHMIETFLPTSNCTDHGLLSPTMGTLERQSDEIIDVVADTGYEDKQDFSDCLENGIIPNTFLSRISDDNGNKLHKKECDVSFPYESSEVSDEERESTKPEDIAKCLRSGIIPDCYKDTLSQIPSEDGSLPDAAEPITITRVERITDDPNGIDSMLDEERIELAREGYFVRDIKGNKVFCPAGQILREKSKKKNGAIRYCNKLACSKCPLRDNCFKPTKTTRWKEVDFSKSCRIKGNGPKAKKPKVIGSSKKIETRVFFRFKVDFEKLNNRKCLSEHPFGTIKRHMNGDHFLLVGLRKVTAEMSLMAMGYNIKRLTSLFDFKTIMKSMQQA